jgi:hypothetical protein
MITNQGAGFMGADVSQAPSLPNTLGFGSVGAILTPLECADDFNVDAGGWTVTSITAFAFMTSTNAFPPATPLFEARVDIYDTTPDLGANVVFTSSTIVSNTWTGIYRTPNADLTNAQRPVMAVEVSFPSIELVAGTYWAAWHFRGLSLTGETTGFTPLVTTVDAFGNPVTATGNGRNRGAGFLWHTSMAGGNIQTVSYPFIVSGTAIPGPGTLALVTLVGVIGCRCRRRLPWM